MDQVLGRIMTQSPRYRDTNKKDCKKLYLVVSQFWLWEIGDCIFTSQCKWWWQWRSAHNESSLDRLSDTMRNGHAMTDEIVGLLLSALFERMAWMRMDHQEHRGVNSTEQPNLLVIFATSIALISQRVTQYLDAGANDEPSIRSEKEFLHNIEDIREELGMLQTVLTQQEEVWREFAFGVWPQHWPTGAEGSFQPLRGFGSEEMDDEQVQMWRIIQRPQFHFLNTKKRLKKLDEDAERAQRSIELKLDLKQRHASLREARNASVMSASVLGFTIVTIIFTPLSFLASLFALPIDQLQQNQTPSTAGSDPVYSTAYVKKWMGKFCLLGNVSHSNTPDLF